MNRREFLKIASAAGTALAGEQSTRAQDQPSSPACLMRSTLLEPAMQLLIRSSLAAWFGRQPSMAEE